MKSVKAVRFNYQPTEETRNLLYTFRMMGNDAINIERRGTIPCLPMVQAEARDMNEAVKGNEQTMAPLLRAEVPKLIRREVNVPKS